MSVRFLVILTTCVAIALLSTDRPDTAAVVHTGGQLDYAIQGRGYFQVADSKGTVGYTRSGEMVVDSSGHGLSTGVPMHRPARMA